MNVQGYFSIIYISRLLEFVHSYNFRRMAWIQYHLPVWSNRWDVELLWRDDRCSALPCSRPCILWRVLSILSLNVLLWIPTNKIHSVLFYSPLFLVVSWVKFHQIESSWIHDYNNWENWYQGSTWHNEKLVCELLVDKSSSGNSRLIK